MWAHPKRAELLDVNINTCVQSINSERASLTTIGCNLELCSDIFPVIPAL